ncbi:DUF2314 domain-containing protein [Gemmata sp. JC673]|uniref:DUF2314 domain-containing protein n=1 Tax=Gemmata algarum TaxID=2975278 RepID=A0ABU5EWY0_9BACT|nr:DUF2314 domain-containing protein [Gemmata algarum]MDY3559448.1 DUF2314 domain-containing protein [Gemmata algarum]
MSESSPVLMFDNSDPAMQRASASARAAFRYFWREVARDRRRIVPALDLACVKAPFSDEGGSDVEHMWLSDMDFDGRTVSGTLVNSPNRLRTVAAGDAVSVPLERTSDWMYAIDGAAFGGYTINLMRSRMDARERCEHDAAWGLDFGDPLQIRTATESEHATFTENLAASLRDHLAQEPAALSETDGNGWTLLHQEAAAGGAATVAVLLEAGADAGAVTDLGLTPLQLARALGWGEAAALLERA